MTGLRGRWGRFSGRITRERTVGPIQITRACAADGHLRIGGRHCHGPGFLHDQYGRRQPVPALFQPVSFGRVSGERASGRGRHHIRVPQWRQFDLCAARPGRRGARARRQRRCAGFRIGRLRDFRQHGRARHHELRPESERQAGAGRRTGPDDPVARPHCYRTGSPGSARAASVRARIHSAERRHHGVGAR